MVFQSYALFPHLDVAGNIAFGLKRRGVDEAEIQRRTGAILELVHLSGYERRRTHELSGGQQQRVALARALVNEPNVLLLDEPLGALDLKLRKRLQVELKRIQMDVGITFVYVTHDQEEALTMSDRIAVMHRGQDRAGRRRRRTSTTGPATPFVADFIGTTNLLSGTVEVARPEARGGPPRLAAIGAGSRPTAGARARRSSSASAPRRSPIDGDADDATAGRCGRLRATVEQMAYLGAAVQYHVRTGGGLALSVLAGKHGSRFASGDSVRLAWLPAEALVLGDRSGELEDEA